MLRYPGSKRKLVKTISKFLEKLNKNCNTYIEPFLGAGFVAANWLQDHQYDYTFLNDKDEDIAGIFNVIIRWPGELIKEIEQFTPSVESFYAFKAARSFYPVKRALETIALHQMSYSGLGKMAAGPIGGKKQNGSYKVDCRWNAKKLAAMILKWHDILKRAYCISSNDFAQVLSLEGNIPTALMYLDPPYYEKGKELYQYSFSEADHQRLFESLNVTRAKWLLSYDDHDFIRRLYRDYYMHEIEASYTIKTHRKKKELLISNYNIFA